MKPQTLRPDETVVSTSAPGQPVLEQKSVKARNGTFASLKVRNYRLYFSGQVVSNIGTWMQRIAQDWLVLELTDSPFAVGVTTALQFAPMLFFGLWGGVLADRYPKRTLLIWSQVMMGLLAAAIAILTITGVVTVVQIYAMALGMGLATVINNPARQSFVNEIVGPDLVPNAIALNAGVFQSARLIGPAVAGLIITAVGSGWAFAINAISFLPAIASLILLRRSELHLTKVVSKKPGQLKEGLKYVAVSPGLRWPIVLVLVVGMFGTNLAVMLTAYTKDVFDSGASVYGLLNSAVAVGAVVGALVAARREVPRLRTLFLSCATFGAVTLLAGLTPWLLAFAGVLMLSGFCSVTFMTMANTSIQVGSAPEFRGRVMSLFGLVMLGGTPVGSIILGAATEYFGPAVAMMFAGSMIILAAIVLAWLVSREVGLRVRFDLHRSATSHFQIVGHRAGS